MKFRTGWLTIGLAGMLALGAGAPFMGRSAQAQTEPARLKSADLSRLLENLGYKTEDISDAVKRVTIERGEFTFRLNISISGNEKKFWIRTFLSQPAPDKLTPELMTKLLTATSDVGPAAFYLTKTNDGKTWIRMGYALDNRGLTPAYVRQEIDWFCDRIAEKVDLWNVK